jgi:transcription elongation factor Elf1
MDDREKLEYWTSIALSAKEQPVVLECFDCCKCGKNTVVAHCFVETVRCFHCGQTQASKSPRPPMPGDVTNEHWQVACKLLKMNHSANQAELPSITDEELSKYNHPIRLLLARHRQQVARETILMMEGVAEELANRDVEAS